MGSAPLFDEDTLVQGRGMRLFFVGDSLVTSGLDYYCPLNRLFIGEGVGYDRCLKLVREIKPDLLFNPHCKGGFSFTDDEIDYMLANWSTLAAAHADYTASRDRLSESAAIFREVGDQRRAGYTLNFLAMVIMSLGDPKLAEQTFRESIEFSAPFPIAGARPWPWAITRKFC